MSGQTRRAQAPTGEGSMFTLEMRTARVAEAAIPLHRALLLRRLGQQPHRHLRGVACTHRVHFFRPASPASPSSLESPLSPSPTLLPCRRGSQAARAAGAELRSAATCSAVCPLKLAQSGLAFRSRSARMTSTCVCSEASINAVSSGRQHRSLRARRLARRAAC